MDAGRRRDWGGVGNEMVVWIRIVTTEMPWDSGHNLGTGLPGP
jgi:hypothetical protein